LTRSTNSRRTAERGRGWVCFFGNLRKGAGTRPPPVHPKNPKPPNPQPPFPEFRTLPYTLLAPSRGNLLFFSLLPGLCRRGPYVVCSCPFMNSHAMPPLFFPFFLSMWLGTFSLWTCPSGATVWSSYASSCPPRT